MKSLAPSRRLKLLLRLGLLCQISYHSVINFKRARSFKERPVCAAGQKTPSARDFFIIKNHTEFYFSAAGRNEKTVNGWPDCCFL